MNMKQGDCLQLMKNMADESVDCIVTDPPYRIIHYGQSGMKGIFSQDRYEPAGKVFRHNDITFSEWLPECYRILKPNCHAYIMTNPRNLKDLWTAAEEAGFVYQQLIVWDKGNLVCNKYYMQGYELILMIRKGNAKTINRPGTANILHIPNVRNKQHPTEKPVELMEILIENSTQPGEVVLDPFFGAGSTALAAINTDRDFIGFELDGAFFDTARDRVERCYAQRMS